MRHVSFWLVVKVYLRSYGPICKLMPRNIYGVILKNYKMKCTDGHQTHVSLEKHEPSNLEIKWLNEHENCQ